MRYSAIITAELEATTIELRDALATARAAADPPDSKAEFAIRRPFQVRRHALFQELYSALDAEDVAAGVALRPVNEITTDYQVARERKSTLRSELQRANLRAYVASSQASR